MMTEIQIEHNWSVPQLEKNERIRAERNVHRVSW
jgi:hypothetical protein